LAATHFQAALKGASQEDDVDVRWRQPEQSRVISELQPPCSCGISSLSREFISYKDKHFSFHPVNSDSLTTYFMSDIVPGSGHSAISKITHKVPAPIDLEINNKNIHQ
jgi:hypothetical protein